MTYTVSSGTLNPSIPYLIQPHAPSALSDSFCYVSRFLASGPVNHKASYRPCNKHNNSKWIFGNSQNEHCQRQTKRNERTTPKLQLCHFILLQTKAINYHAPTLPYLHTSLHNSYLRISFDIIH